MSKIISLGTPINKAIEQMNGFGMRDEIKSPKKDMFGVFPSWTNMSANLKILALDEDGVHGQHMYLSSTWEGSAVQASMIIVHDIPELNALGPCLTDGHALLVSQPELKKRLGDHQSLREWIRAGAGLCAALALPDIAPVQKKSVWKAVSSQDLLGIFNAHNNKGVSSHYNPQAAQDAWRHASSILMFCRPNDSEWFQNISKISPTTLSSGIVNDTWGRVLQVHQKITESIRWQHRSTQPPTVENISDWLVDVSLAEMPLCVSERLGWKIACAKKQYTFEEKVRCTSNILDGGHSSVEDIQSLIRIFSAISDEYGEDGPDIDQKSEYNKSLSEIFFLYHDFENHSHSNPKDQLMALVSHFNNGYWQKEEDEVNAFKAIIHQASTAGPYSSQELELIATFAPFALQTALRSTPGADPVFVVDPLDEIKRDLFQVVGNGFVDLNDKDDGFTPLSYTSMMVHLIEAEQASLSLSPHPDNESINTWNFLASDFEENWGANKTHWISIVSAAQKQNPNFATELLGCWCLCGGTAPTPALMETLIDQGADLLAHHRYEDVPPSTIASELLSWCQHPSIRVKAQRALKEQQDKVVNSPSDNQENNVVSLCAIRNSFPR